MGKITFEFDVNDPEDDFPLKCHMRAPEMAFALHEIDEICRQQIKFGEHNPDAHEIFEFIQELSFKFRDID